MARIIAVLLETSISQFVSNNLNMWLIFCVQFSADLKLTFEITDWKFKINTIYTTLTNFSMKYLMMCKVYTYVGGIK